MHERIAQQQHEATGILTLASTHRIIPQLLLDALEQPLRILENLDMGDEVLLTRSLVINLTILLGDLVVGLTDTKLSDKGRSDPDLDRQRFTTLSHLKQHIIVIEVQESEPGDRFTLIIPRLKLIMIVCPSSSQLRIAVYHLIPNINTWKIPGT